ncbi:MAG: PEP-CTERM sorting domain-containing protein [Pirellulales bacterium]|nr:PEP-CTERM sorting domain-containing protein [Pirellulales bacterium]
MNRSIRRSISARVLCGVALAAAWAFSSAAYADGLFENYIAKATYDARIFDNGGIVYKSSDQPDDMDVSWSDTYVPLDGISFDRSFMAETHKTGPWCWTSGAMGGHISIENFYSYHTMHATTDIRYEIIVYNVNGTATPQLVPIEFEEILSAQFDSMGTPDYVEGNAVAALWVSTNDWQTSLLSDRIEAYYRNSAEREASQKFEGSTTLYVQVGSAPLAYTKLQVRLVAACNATVRVQRSFDKVREGACSFTALADPMVSIDPTWEYADQFGLVFSPGVVPALVPEPGIWVLLCAGGASWLFLLVRRRKAVA